MSKDIGESAVKQKIILSNITDSFGRESEEECIALQVVYYSFEDATFIFSKGTILVLPKVAESESASAVSFLSCAKS